MNIAVTTRYLFKNNTTGVGWFTFETIRRLVEKHPEHNFYYLFDRPFDQKFITSNNIIPIHIRPKCYFHPIFYRLWYNICVPRVLKKHKIDLFFSTDGFLPLTIKIPSILTIHDLAFEHSPQFISDKMAKYFRKETPKYVKKASQIVTVSEYTKKDIFDTYHTNPDKITVVYNGRNQAFRPCTEEEKKITLKKYTNNTPFFIFIGTIHPRKNAKNQLLAYESFRKNNPELNHKFVFVGKNWFWEEETQNIFDAMTFKKDVIFIGYISMEELTKLTAAATFLMYVSFFEGFGIPIIEAFAAETPVITSNTSSMPEIAGDAALIVDPYSVDEIEKAMATIVFDEEKRESLITKGNQRKELFSWEKTASLLDTVFCNLVKNINKNTV